MDSTDSSTGLPQPNLPPGFRFHPTDEELVVHYLEKKAASAPLPVSIIAEVDLYKFDPWELPAKATFGEHEWYFFTPRDRKYPNGARPNRAATSGYWKATGTDKPVVSAGTAQKVGVKKALVFYRGKPPKGVKTDWIMHEYRLITENITSSRPPGWDSSNNKKASLRLDDWVLCRIYKKNYPPRPLDHERDHFDHFISMGEMFARIPTSSIPQQHPKLSSVKASNYGPLLENEQNLFEEMIGSDGGGTININTGYTISPLGITTSTDSKPEQLPTVSSTSLQRTLPLHFWTDDGNDGCPEAAVAKRFRGEGTENNNSMATLLMSSSLSQLQQTPSMLHQQTMMGSLGDGVFRSWYS